MKKNSLRIFAILLAVLMSVAMLAACQDTTKPTEPATDPATDPATEPATDPSTEPDRTNVIALGDYKVFYSEHGSDGGLYVVDNLMQNSGKTVEYSTSEFAFEEPKEIIIASKRYYDKYNDRYVDNDFSRAGIDEIYADLEGGQFRIVRKDNDDGERIYIVGSSNVMCLEACQYFIQHFIANSEPIENGYEYTSTCNPSGYAPYIYQENGTYYMFSQNGGMKYATSTDLVNWSGYDNSLDLTLPAGVSEIKDVELHKINGKYYFVGAKDNKLVLLVSDSLTGKFAPVKDGSLLGNVPYTVNYPTLYTDKDGVTWCVYVSDWLARTDYRGNVWGVKLNADLTDAAEEPFLILSKGIVKVGSVTNDTERPHVYVTEKGTLLILFSDYDSAKKAVRDRSMAIYVARSNDGTLTGKMHLDNASFVFPNYEEGGYLWTMGGYTMGSIVTAPDGSLKAVVSSDDADDWGRILFRDVIADSIDDAVYIDLSKSFTIVDWLRYNLVED